MTIWLGFLATLDDLMEEGATQADKIRPPKKGGPGTATYSPLSRLLPVSFLLHTHPHGTGCPSCILMPSLLFSKYLTPTEDQVLDRAWR